MNARRFWAPLSCRTTEGGQNHRRVLALACAVALSVCATAQTRVACVGDSNFMGNYPKELQQILGSKYEVKTFGAEGATVTGFGSGEFNQSKEFKAALKYAPNTVVVLLGNDMFGEIPNVRMDSFEPALRTLLERFRDSKAHPKVYLWLFPDGKFDPVMRSYNEFCHPLARQAARESGTTTIESDNFALGFVGKETATLLDMSVTGPTGSGQNFYQDATAAKDGANFVAENIAPSSLKANWRIVRASSSQADEGPAQNAIDGDPDTFWHSQYDPTEAKPPHEIVINLGKEVWLAGFKYLPRQDGGVNGNVKSYEIYVGDSPGSQSTLAAKGVFGRGSSQKLARFKTSVKARYIRFVCLSEQTGGPFASAAEFDILRDPTKH